MKRPFISLICSSFNHENYISFFIESILKQEYDNFELIINDDCSTDNTFNIALSYNDSRVKVYKNEINCGPALSVNKMFDKCSGDYIVFCSSDDMYKEEFLSNIVNIFKDDEIGVVYSNLDVIDENNLHYDYWNIKYDNNTDKYAIISDFFYFGNTLFSPGMAVKKNILEHILPLNISFVSHEDTEMHIKILSITKPYFNKKYDVNYRVAKINNASLSNNLAGRIRDEFELNRLMNIFLEIDDIDIYKFILKQKGLDLKKDSMIKFYLGLAAVKCCDLNRQKWGYGIIMDYIHENGYDNLLKIENFKFSDYILLASKYANKTTLHYEVENNKIRSKYRKYKRISICLSIILISLLICLSCFNV